MLMPGLNLSGCIRKLSHFTRSALHPVHDIVSLRRDGIDALHSKLSLGLGLFISFFLLLLFLSLLFSFGFSCSCSSLLLCLPLRFLSCFLLSLVLRAGGCRTSLESRSGLHPPDRLGIRANSSPLLLVVVHAGIGRCGCVLSCGGCVLSGGGCRGINSVYLASGASIRG